MYVRDIKEDFYIAMRDQFRVSCNEADAAT